MRKIRTEEIEQAVYELAKKACLNLTPDCVKAVSYTHLTLPTT